MHLIMERRHRRRLRHERGARHRQLSDFLACAVREDSVTETRMTSPRPCAAAVKTRRFLLIIFLALLVGQSGCATMATVRSSKGDFPHEPPPPEGGVVNPGYLFLIPLTVPFDVATSPVQGLWW